jgi:hypothetical protein
VRTSTTVHVTDIARIRRSALRQSVLLVSSGCSSPHLNLHCFCAAVDLQLDVSRETEARGRFAPQAVRHKNRTNEGGKNFHYTGRDGRSFETDVLKRLNLRLRPASPYTCYHDRDSSRTTLMITLMMIKMMYTCVPKGGCTSHLYNPLFGAHVYVVSSSSSSSPSIFILALLVSFELKV